MTRQICQYCNIGVHQRCETVTVPNNKRTYKDEDYCSCEESRCKAMVDAYKTNRY